MKLAAESPLARSWQGPTLVVCLFALACGGALQAAEPELVGVLALAVEDDVASQLGLSPQQREALLRLIDQREQAGLDAALKLKDLPASERRQKLAPFRQESEKQGLALLAPKQRTLLEQIHQRRLALAAPNEPEGAQTTADAAAAAEDADAAPPERATAPEGQRAEPTANRPAQPPRGDGKLQFNFRYQPWADVLDWFAEQAELSLVLDAPPPGTFNYTDPRAYTPTEAIDLLNGVLLTKGYTLVRRERMLMLINLADGIPPNLVPMVPLEKLDQRGDNELVSVLFELHKLTPEEADEEIKKLLGPQGSVVVLTKARQIQVTETAGRLRTIRSVIEAVEDPQQRAERFEVFPLTHLAPDEALGVVRQLLNLGEAGEGAADATLRITAAPSGGKLLASGRPDRLAQLKDVLAAIDVPSGGATSEPGVVQTPQLEVYVVAPADPQAVLQVLQTLLAGQPGVRLATDPRTGNLVALARPDQHATIRATLAQMQQDAHQVEVIHLQKVDPQAAVLAINKLFGADKDDKGDAASSAPKVDADPVSRALLVRGTARQVEQIRELLSKLGESGEGEAPGERRSVRILPLHGRSVRSALEQIEQIWPSFRSNPIRVVTPSSSGSAARSIPVPPSLERLLQHGRQPQRPPQKPAAKTPQPPSDGKSNPPEQPPPDNPKQPGTEKSKQPGVDKSAAGLPIRRPVRLLGGAGGVAPLLIAQAAGDAESDANDGDAPAEQAPSPKDAAPQDAKPSPPAGAPAPILVVPGPNGTLIASEDLDALDEFEQLLDATAGRAAGAREFTVFYLKHAQAAVVGETLREIFGGGSGGDEGGGGGLIGDLAGAALGDVGGGLLGGILGLGAAGGAGGLSGGVLIVPDLRLNALVVHGRPAELDMIEQLLEVLDQPDSPEEVQVAARSQVIPVLYTSAQSIADTLRQVYADRLVAGAGTPPQPSPQDFIRALRGSRGRGSSSRDVQAPVQKMSIAVDARSNSIIVSAPQALFEEVRTLVLELDQQVTDSQTTRVITLKRSTPQAVGSALSSLLGSGVKTHTTTGEQPAAARSATATPSTTPGATPGAASPGQGTPGFEPFDPAAIQRRIEFFRRMREQREAGGDDRGRGRSGDGSRSNRGR